MNIIEIKKYVAEVCEEGDINFRTAAEYVQQVIEKLEAKELVGDEAVEILHDIGHQVEIMQELENLELKQKLNAAINALIKLASMAV